MITIPWWLPLLPGIVMVLVLLASAFWNRVGGDNDRA